MSMQNKLKNKTQETVGTVKENVGRSTRNRSLEAEGRKDRMSGSLKQAGEKVKDAFKK
jgi:uncharacterized protein YjbJ (UPF0337 family)